MEGKVKVGKGRNGWEQTPPPNKLLVMALATVSTRNVLMP